MGYLRAPSRANALLNVVARVTVFVFMVETVHGQDQVLTPANFNIAQGRTVCYFNFFVVVFFGNRIILIYKGIFLEFFYKLIVLHG